MKKSVNVTSIISIFSRSNLFLVSHVKQTRSGSYTNYATENERGGGGGGDYIIGNIDVDVEKSI